MNCRVLTLKIFVFAALVLIGVDRTGRSQENSVGANRQITDWGQMSNGLQMRVGAPASIVSEELVELRLEFRITSDELEPHIEDVILLPPGTRATLDVYNEVTGRQTQHVWRQSGRPGLNPARFSASTDDSRGFLSTTIKIPTPLVIVESEVRCKLDLFVPAFDSSAWNGFVSSPLFDLTLIPKHSEIETLTVVFPRECRLLPGPRLGCDTLSMDSVKIAYHKGLCVSGSYTPDDMVITDRWFSLPWNIVFEDGRMSTWHKFNIYESTDCPQHAWELEGKVFRILWEREYQFTLIKEQMDSLTIPEREQFSYHTYLMPRQIRVTDKGEVVADESNPIPIECKMKREYEVGYWVSIDSEFVESFYHAPRSPLYQLPRLPTCESPVDFGIALFQFRRDLIGTDKMDSPPRITRLWAANALLSTTAASVEMEQSKDLRLPRQTVWRQCRMPRRLRINSDWQVVADMSDPIMVDFKESEGYLPLVRLQVGTDTLGFMSTFLPDILCQLDPSVSQDSLLNVTLSLARVADSCPPPPRVYTWWSKEYQLVVPQALGDSTEGGRRGEH
ncbi:MAG: hypothetical protein JSV52_07400 [Candidatus Zixiibacteriota bacterium]|nr:MAG: hypothetical protein JSV52_07400 [candidate division Zixibacteria bacterium]